MKRQTAGLLGAVVFALPLATPAAEKSEKGAAHPSMKPAAELKELDDMVGAWKCQSEMHMPPEMGGEQKTQSTMTIKKTLNGHWLVGQWKSEKTKTMPSMQGLIYWGYDPAAKKFVEMGLDSTGGMMRGTSDPSPGDKRVWEEEGVMMGKKTMTRTTITKKGPNEVEVAVQMEAEPGKWVPMEEDHCKK